MVGTEDGDVAGPALERCRFPEWADEESYLLLRPIFDAVPGIKLEQRYLLLQQMTFGRVRLTVCTADHTGEHW